MGKILKQIAPRSYIVQSQNGTQYCRNRINIRPRPSNSDDKIFNDCDFYDVAPREFTNVRRDCDTNVPEISRENNLPCNRSQRIRRRPIWFNDFEV